MGIYQKVWSDFRTQFTPTPASEKRKLEEIQFPFPFICKIERLYTPDIQGDPSAPPPVRALLYRNLPQRFRSLFDIGINLKYACRPSRDNRNPAGVAEIKVFVAEQRVIFHIFDKYDIALLMHIGGRRILFHIGQMGHPSISQIAAYSRRVGSLRRQRPAVQSVACHLYLGNRPIWQDINFLGTGLSGEGAVMGLPMIEDIIFPVDLLDAPVICPCGIQAVFRRSPIYPDIPVGDNDTPILVAVIRVEAGGVTELMVYMRGIDEVIEIV